MVRGRRIEFFDVLKSKRVIPAVVELMITQVITALLCRVGLVGLGRLAFTEKVTGSNPVRDTKGINDKS